MGLFRLLFSGIQVFGMSADPITTYFWVNYSLIIVDLQNWHAGAPHLHILLNHLHFNFKLTNTYFSYIFAWKALSNRILHYIMTHKGFSIIPPL